MAALVAITILVSGLDDWDAYTDKRELYAKLDNQSQHLEEQQRLMTIQAESMRAQKVLLAAQQSMLSSQQATLATQQLMMVEQEKSIGSVLFNTETSFEGKMRFLRNFCAFAHAANLKKDNTGFEGIVCDDGVAMYWFDSETEAITGFHFFTNSEINRVLSGTPPGKRIVDDNGNVLIAADSEISIAFRDCLFRRLPMLSDDHIVEEENLSRIMDEIHTILRYVYRAQGVEFKPEYEGERGGRHRPSKGAYAILLQYVVNPFANIKRLNSFGPFDLEVTKPFLDSLHGLTIAEFSEKVIEQFRVRKFEPKVRVKDIRILQMIRLVNEWQDVSPFSPYTPRIRGN